MRHPPRSVLLAVAGAVTLVGSVRVPRRVSPHAECRLDLSHLNSAYSGAPSACIDGSGCMTICAP